MVNYAWACAWVICFRVYRSLKCEASDKNCDSILFYVKNKMSLSIGIVGTYRLVLLLFVETITVRKLQDKYTTWGHSILLHASTPISYLPLVVLASELYLSILHREC